MNNVFTWCLQILSCLSKVVFASRIFCLTNLLCILFSYMQQALIVLNIVISGYRQLLESINMFQFL